MKRLWAPWRSKYIEGFSKMDNHNETDTTCLFCDVLTSPGEDEDKFILTRWEHCYVLMNLYPYNSGHLMVVPNRHIDSLTGLRNEEQLEIMNLLTQCFAALNETLKPHGFNLGTNIGRVSGAGIEHHIHFHIVPRWNGDTNFMPVLSETKVISEELPKTYRKLKNYLQKASHG